MGPDWKMIAEKLRDALRSAEDLVRHANIGAFANGVENGGMDEGEVRTSVVMDDVCVALRLADEAFGP